MRGTAFPTQPLFAGAVTGREAQRRGKRRSRGTSRAHADGGVPGVPLRSAVAARVDGAVGRVG